MSTTPPPKKTFRSRIGMATPPPKTPFRSRVGTAMRRSSTNWMPGLPKSNTPPPEDSVIIPGSPPPRIEREGSTASLKQLDITPPPSTQLTTTTIPESPAREAAALAGETALQGPPLLSGGVLTPPPSTQLTTTTIPESPAREAAALAGETAPQGPPPLSGGVLTAEHVSEPSLQAPEERRDTDETAVEPAPVIPSVVVNSPEPAAEVILSPTLTEEPEEMSPPPTREPVQKTPPDSTQAPVPATPEVVLQDLVKHITKIGNYAVARGGFGEIWKCIYQTDRGPINVAVKSLLVYTSDEVTEATEKKTKRIYRELKICVRLKHQNIMPVHGCTSGFGPFMAIVSPWAENGNLSTYLERDDTSLTVIRRFQILRDIMAGLQYLHANRVIHGDLTSPNVLIHGDGTACLADFGLSLLYSEVVSISQASWTSTFHGNARWMAPELLRESEDDQPVRPSKYSDIYSFGGIMLQVLTSKIPYYYLREAAVSVPVYNGVKPSRSRYPAVPDTYWHFIEECWSITPQDRPSAERVVEVISNELNSLSSPSADS